MMAMDGTQTDSVGGWRGEHSLRSMRRIVNTIGMRRIDLPR